MSLVDYESSSSDSEIPELPESFHENYVTLPRLGDDPEFHQGRHRLIPHIKGSYPTHVYIEWVPRKRDAEKLKSYCEQVTGQLNHVASDQMHSLVQSSLGALLPLHISLTDTIMLPGQLKNEFVDDISRAISDAVRENSADKSVELNSGPVALYNADRSRLFIALKVRDGQNGTLSRIQRCINDAKLTRKYHFPPLGSMLHVSVCWIDAKTSNYPAEVTENLTDWTPMEISINKVCVRIGRETKRIYVK